MSDSCSMKSSTQAGTFKLFSTSGSPYPEVNASFPNRMLFTASIAPDKGKVLHFLLDLASVARNSHKKGSINPLMPED